MKPPLGQRPALCKKRRLLCVDDDKDTIELLRVIFGFAGYDVKTAETALVATHRLRTSLFDLYVLDNRLPDMNGLDLIKKIRAFDASTPIVLSSADAREQEQDRALACGAQAYLIKPWEPDLLVATVKNLIQQSERRALDARLAETNAILQEIEDHGERVEHACYRAQRVRAAARAAFVRAGGAYADFHRHFPGTLAVSRQSRKRKT